MNITPPQRPIIVIAMIILIILLGSYIVPFINLDNKSVKSIETSVATIRFLWDPNSNDLEEWQTFKLPVDIIVEPEGDLFVCDAVSGYVIRFSAEGKPKEIIGGQGAGPGEFSQPKTVAFDIENKELWVLDKALSRISVFEVNSEGTRLADILPTPQFKHSRFPYTWKLLIQNSEKIWITALENDKRIHRINRNGKVILSFGEKWVPQNVSLKTISDLNEGTLVAIGEDSLAFIWKCRPKIEIWDTEGNLLSEYDYWLPEFSSLYEYRLSGIEDTSFFYYNADAFYDDEFDALFLCLASQKSPYVIYLLSIGTLQPLFRFVLPDETREMGLHNYDAIRTDSGWNFFSIDTQSYGILLIQLRIH